MFIPKPVKELTREDLLSMLRDFINQRPGFDFANYGDMRSYRSDYRQSLQQRDDALAMLAIVEAHESIDADAIRAELTNGNRLSLEVARNKRAGVVTEGTTLHYTAGQYWCTEYRAGACRVLSRLLWDYWCASAINGDAVRSTARRTFPRGTANRWFN